MEKRPKRITHLSKVLVSLHSEQDQTDVRSSTQAGEATFIYGVGSQGLTPFEYELAGKSAGDVVFLTIRPHEWQPFFGHLAAVLPLAHNPQFPTTLHVLIEDVRESDQREIIRAMAEASPCGGGCCGHH